MALGFRVSGLGPWGLEPAWPGPGAQRGGAV